MSSKTSKKKPGKKVKPSRPAVAVLWGLDPSSERGAAVRALLREMGVAAKTARPEQLGLPAGVVAGGHGGVPVAPAGEGPACEFVLLSGFTRAQVDEFLARSREAGCVVGAKAVLTPANRNWPLGRLIEAVAAEHAAMGGDR